jgi:hypothetical protein
MRIHFKFTRLKAVVLATAIVALAAPAAWFWDKHGTYGVNVVLRRGGSWWLTMRADDSRLSPAMREALKVPAPQAHPGSIQWKTLAPGFAAGELPVIADGEEVDRILLARIDPARYKFTVRNAPAGDKGIDEWEAALPRSILIVNASYFDPKGLPDTPVLSDGNALGPRAYDARSGAFVAGEGGAQVVDLTGAAWQRSFRGSSNAMVSYPLLIGNDGKSHVASRSRWLANRTFIGQSRDGRILIGTTRDAFFSLDRLAEFLIASPLDLKLALNLDGGPVACQSIRLGSFHRKFHARWEAQVSSDTVKLLSWPWGSYSMAMVLSVERR